jgi:hypothetical protein
LLEGDRDKWWYFINFIKSIHMKICIPVICFLILAACINIQSYGQLPVLNAKTRNATYSISGNATQGWGISPRIERDTLLVNCFQKTETVLFKTDTDSISFPIRAGETKSFYVKMKDSANALTVVYAVSPYQQLSFSKDPDNKGDLKFWYGFHSMGYRDTLETLYPSPLPNTSNNNDVAKIAYILKWTHNQWKHSGMNSPKKNDPVSILTEAKAGGQFPCFAYSIVLAGKLNAAGFMSRVLYLKGKDVETNKIVPGHVVTEVYIPSLKKWAFLDGQFNVMPMLKGVPLNAVEFQRALTQNFAGVSFFNAPDYNGDPWSIRSYADFVYPYLYFFDFSFDNRAGLAGRNTIQGKTNLMLVPAGVKPPVKFGAFPTLIDYCIYTNDLEKFYAAP